METIIEEQEKEFWNMCEEYYVGSSSDLHINKHPTKILKWHKEKVKQILQALVERESRKLQETPTPSSDLVKTATETGFMRGKADTIQYLQEQIKKL